MSDHFGRFLRPAVTVALGIFIVGALATAPPPAEDRAQRIGAQIRCPVCSGESIAASPNQLAQDMMARVRQLVADGYTDEQVIRDVIGGYTDAQRLDPPFSAGTAALWAIPATVLVAGAFIGARTKRSAERLDE